MATTLAIAGLVCIATVGALIWYCIVFPRRSKTAPLPKLNAEGLDLASRLSGHIAEIAQGPRNIAHFVSLESAATHIQDTLYEVGHRPEIQEFPVAGKYVRNIEVVFEPQIQTEHPATLILGAHYDSDGVSPGAHDNGTGVAATLELARRLKGWQPQHHRLRLLFWVNEEHPWGKTKNMGSWQHAKMMKDQGENIMGAIALETLGYFSTKPDSQRLPFPFSAAFSNVGDFVAFVALPKSRIFLERVTRAFRNASVFPSVGGLAPGYVEGVDLSDHWAYHQFGYPALMVTDTAPFRNPYYHSINDLPDTVDYDSLSYITMGLENMVRRLVR